ncbi:MAG: HD domain-containing protein [Candidatus Portnoybacteria bacterium]|nr:HD domain-containing protein [Candidatus Portnoybacteria bacterium]
MSLLDKVEQFVINACSENHSDISHHQKTVYWIKKLKPEAEEALLIAGMSHDIERAFNGDWKAGSSDPAKLKKHQELSADEIEKFLEKEQAPKELIEKAINLILHHEEGGTEDQNILCDADCLAYFEEKSIKKAAKARAGGKSEEYRKKLDYLFNRIHSLEARQIAQPLYDASKKELRS